MSIGKAAADILGGLRVASPSSAPSRATVYCLVKRFSSGHSTVKVVRGKFKPPTVTDDKTVDFLKELVDGDPRVTIRYIAEYLGLHSGSVWHILRHKLGYRKVCVQWVLQIKILHDDAPAHRSHVLQEYLQEENIQTLPHHPYSYVLSPWNFFLFPHLKKCSGGRRFNS